MTAPGETDLVAMLASLDVARRPGTFAFVEIPGRATTELVDRSHAVVIEEGARGTTTTLVLSVEDADAASLSIDVEMAWLTLTAESSLEAVGLTAAFSRALGDAGVPCNVLAGYRHDHLLVPADRADSAIEVLRSLRDRSSPDG
ncbi:MAG: ACT domain-containing protein [Actinomycetota bacterium]